MEVFWDQGFAATSLDQLGEAMSMNRPSIQAAFGDKTELFLKVLERYEEDMRLGLTGALGDEVPLEPALRRMFATLLAHFSAEGTQARGCLLFTVAAAEALRTPAVQAVVARAQRALEAALTERFVGAAERGELPAAANPADCAVLAVGLVHTLSARVRAGDNARALKRVVDVYLASIFASAS